MSDEVELVDYNYEEVWKELKRAAETIDEEIEQLERAAQVTNETLRIEFTI